MFTFSRLLGQVQVAQQYITFTGPVKLIVCSPLAEFCRYVSSLLLADSTLTLGSVSLSVQEIAAFEPDVSKESIVVRTLSPVVAYSTLKRPDGRSYTCYFQPGEEDFKRLVEGNLQRKLQAFGYEDVADEFELQPIGRHRQNIVTYKKFIVKGSSGKFRLTGSKRALTMALSAGLGSKNSQGFGCVELDEERRGGNDYRKLGAAGPTADRR